MRGSRSARGAAGGPLANFPHKGVKNGRLVQRIGLARIVAIGALFGGADHARNFFKHHVRTATGRDRPDEGRAQHAPDRPVRPGVGDAQQRHRRLLPDGGRDAAAAARRAAVAQRRRRGQRVRRVLGRAAAEGAGARQPRAVARTLPVGVPRRLAHGLSGEGGDPPLSLAGETHGISLNYRPCPSRRFPSCPCLLPYPLRPPRPRQRL
ncbi:protein of unknown function [Burkholderia multivorans]